MSYTTGSSMTLFDENYNLFMETSPLFSCDAKLFDFNDTNDFLSAATYDSLLFDCTPYDVSACEAPATCNPDDIMAPPIDFESLLGDNWSEALLGSIDHLSQPTTVAPSQLMTPPQSLPSTPQMASKSLHFDSANIGLVTPPPSDRPAYRTRRFKGSESILQLSQLTLNAPKPVGQTVNPASAAKTSAYIPCTPNVPPTTNIFTYTHATSSYNPTHSYSSPDFDLSSPSSSGGSPIPVRRPVRAAGVQRVVVSDFRRGRQGNQPVPSGDPERPHGCRHPGRTPGDLPCNLDFARKHDWSRHQRVHTGETPYSCRGCDRPFKRPDARGRHWDSRPECEATHTTIVRELLLNGEMSTDDRDVPVLRRRAQKAECRRESRRTGVPVGELKAMMRNVKNEDVEGFGF